MSDVLRPYKDLFPQIGNRVMIDTSSVVIGDARLADDVGIWPLVAIRGDVNYVQIGARTNIQDGSVLHVTHKSTSNPQGNPLIVGEDVTVGHKKHATGIVGMNQAIQFPDREEWRTDVNAVVFPAMVHGMQLTCAISGEIMASRFGGDTPEQWLEIFQQHRWDLEEEAEALIQAQQEDAQGWVWLL